MNILAIGVLFVLAFIIQYVLTYIQINSFNRSYRKLRLLGRVAIGRKKGVARAGAIVMLAIDKNNKVVQGEIIQGVTVLARFKSFDYFNGLVISTINKEDCKALRLSKSLTEAVLDCVTNFKIVAIGGKIEESDSPFGKISKKIKKITKNK